jgi:anaerobic magnesium-protoporphyrin IX monomethyl ester cyclase
MKLALAAPNCPTEFGDVGPPLNLATLAAYVRKQLPDLEVKIFDGTIQGVDVYQSIMDFQPDVVGLTSITPQINSAYKLMETLRSVKPEILTVIGGCHVSTLPEEATPHADCVVIGEGEHALLEILKLKKSNSPVPKIIEGKPFENLDDLPLPAYDLLDMDKYMDFILMCAYELAHPTGRMMTSRGCNYRCPFCYNSVRHSKVRYRSASKIIEELEYLQEHYGIKSIWYHDDEFLANKKRFKELVALWPNSKIKGKMEWACQARVDSINDEIVKLAKENGCIEVFLGIESATPKTLKYLKCNTITVEDIERALLICKKHNLPVHGSFIFGAPDETLTDMKQTWKWINKHRSLMVSIGTMTLTPFPASKIWAEHMKGRQVDYDKLGYHGEIYQRYMVDDAITPTDFQKFFKDKVLLSWFGNQIATKPLWKALAHKTSGIMLLKHPVDVLQIIWSKRLK